MAITPVTDANYSHLHALQRDLISLKKSNVTVFLKVVGDGKDQHVEVVKGQFWNFVAKVACFFGVRSYDLQEVSRVFQNQLNSLEKSFCNELASKTKHEMRHVGMRVSKVFIYELTHLVHIRNGAIEDNAKTAIINTVQGWKRHFVNLDKKGERADITALFSEQIFKPSSKSKKNRPSSVKDVYKGELNSQLNDTIQQSAQTVGRLLQVDLSKISNDTEDVRLQVAKMRETLGSCKEQIKGIADQLLNLTKLVLGSGVRYKGDIIGSLAHSTYSKISEKLDRLQRVIEAPIPQGNEGITSWLKDFNNAHTALQEAEFLLNGFQVQEKGFIDIVAARRGTLLLELSALLRKAESIVLNQESVKGTPQDAQVRAALPDLKAKLAALDPAHVSENELHDFFEEVKSTLGLLQPYWKETLAIKGESLNMVSLSLADLIKEWQSHFAEMQRVKEQVIDSLPGIEKKLQRAQKAHMPTSLSFMAYERAKNALKAVSYEGVEASFAEIAVLLNHESQDGKRALRLILLRELLLEAKKHIDANRKNATKKERLKFALVERKIKAFSNRLGFDPTTLQFSKSRLENITDQELVKLGTLMDHLDPLYSSPDIRADLHFKALSRHRREFKSLVKSI